MALLLWKVTWNFQQSSNNIASDTLNINNLHNNPPFVFSFQHQTAHGTFQKKVVRRAHSPVIVSSCSWECGYASARRREKWQAMQIQEPRGGDDDDDVEKGRSEPTMPLLRQLLVRCRKYDSETDFSTKFWWLNQWHRELEDAQRQREPFPSLLNAFFLTRKSEIEN